MRASLFSFMILAVLLLSGCISREQADTKLQEGCEAGITAFLPEGSSISVKNKSFKDNTEWGSGIREVTLTVLEFDGWNENEKQYTCIFAENRGLGGSFQSASIRQLQTPDTNYGEDKDGKPIGEMNDNYKLTEAVDKIVEAP